MTFKFLAALSLTVSVLGAAPALAAAQERPIELQSKVQVLVPGAEGEQARLTDAERVVPGDTLVFTTGFRNGSDAAVRDFVIVNPVPANMRVSDESAASSDVSVDGGKTWGRLADLKTVDSEGQEHPATAGDITHLRWKFVEIPPQEAGEVKFSASVR